MAIPISPRPSTPTTYVAGRITLPANTVQNLLVLIQRQLDPNCPGGPREVRLTVVSGGNIYIGAASPLGGALSATNCAYSLAAGQSRTYKSNYPGSNVALGNLQVLASSATQLNVEVQA